MLSTYLAEVLDDSINHSSDGAFIEFFCDYNKKEQNSATSVLRGLIYQLLRRMPYLSNHILPSFRIHRDLIESFASLWSIFEAMIRDCNNPTVCCLVDGLDECDTASLEALVPKLCDLFLPDQKQASICRLRMILVSRRQPHCLQRDLEAFPRIRLEADVNYITNNIPKFIKEKVDSKGEGIATPLQIAERDG